MDPATSSLSPRGRAPAHPEPGVPAPGRDAPTAPARAPGPVVATLARWNRALSRDFLGGPRVLKLSWVVNFQKGGTAPFVALLMALWGNTRTEAWVYLALHGTYGLCWLLKDAAFPDRNWQERVTFGGAFLSFALVLGPYWSFPVLLVTDVLGPRPEAPAWRLALAIAAHTLGLAIMLAADCQKHFTLRVRQGLVTDGMFRFVRHPNYLGEMLLYGSYALLVWHPWPWLVLGWVWGAVFYVNMKMKEASLSRHPGWAEYEARTGMLLPRLLRR